MVSRPTGTVTLLFTDVEQSTIAWEQHPEAMAEALGHHDKVLRSTIEGHGGFVFAAGGDGFAAAFATADDAARAAIESQRELRTNKWPHGVRLASRMGLHTGSAEERDGNYFGPVVNRAARIMATGSGGQVLVSAATATLLDHTDVQLLDLGVHRLRDLLAPERLHQLVIDGDHEAYPSLRTLEHLNQNLPTVPTSLHGRDDDVARLHALLEGTPLVTLTGPGGVGKTRLALEVAANELDVSLGAYFIDLAPVSGADAVPRTFAAGLGLPATESVDGPINMLLDRPSIVVLDNCEHVVDAVATLAQDIVQRCPESRVLATSREPLGIDGEQVWRVAPLSREAALDLFFERARAVRTDLVADLDAEAAAGEIVERVDRLPLALELAAARASHLSIPEISEHLDTRFDLLTGGRRRASARQQTLLATLDWSYKLLSSDEQALLRTCSVFGGSFTLDALVGVADLPETAVLDGLGSLVAKSLVMTQTQPDGTTRYRLLESVRMYGRDRLIESGEAADGWARHVHWYVGTANSTAMSVRIDDWLDESEDKEPARFFDLEDVLAALAWCDAHDDLVSVGQLAVDALRRAVGNEWCDRSWRYLGREDVADALPPLERAYYFFACAENANAVGDFALQRTYCERALSLVDGGPLHDVILLTLSVATSVTEPERAEAMVDEVLRSAPPGSRMAHEAVHLKAGAVTMQGDLRGAIAIREHAPLRGFGATELAITLHLLGEHERLAEVLANAPIKRRNSWSWFRYPMVTGLEQAHAGDIESALDAEREAARLRSRVPDQLLDRDVLVAVAGVACLGGDPFRCARLLAVEEHDLRTRSPASWQLYLHYRRLARASLTRAEVAAARHEARGFTVRSALEAELEREPWTR